MARESEKAVITARMTEVNDICAQVLIQRKAEMSGVCLETNTKRHVSRNEQRVASRVQISIICDNMLMGQDPAGERGARDARAI